MKTLLLTLALILFPMFVQAKPIYCIDEKAVWHTLKNFGKDLNVDGQRFFYDKEWEVNGKRMSLYKADSGQKGRMVLILQGKDVEVYWDVYNDLEELVYTSHCNI